jgi:hypothetical protein
MLLRRRRLIKSTSIIGWKRWWLHPGYSSVRALLFIWPEHTQNAILKLEKIARKSQKEKL